MLAILLASSTVVGQEESCKACDCQFNNLEILTEFIESKIATVLARTLNESSKFYLISHIHNNIGSFPAPKNWGKAISYCIIYPASGVTYTRWGKSSCPNNTGAELVYSGQLGGTNWNVRGGSAENVCLPDDPEYLNETAGVTIPYYSIVQGSEYELFDGPIGNVSNYKVPCAVCYVPTRSTSIMVPAKLTCQPSWTREYYGYLTTEHDTHHRSSYTCIDNPPEIIPVFRRIHSDGLLLLLHTVTDCLGLQCPPYENLRLLSCTVCTK